MTSPAPTAAAVAVPVVAADSAPASVALRVAPPSTADDSITPARVLLVANDRRFRALAATLLSQRGYVVTAARGSDNVLEVAERERVDAVVIDASASLTAAARQAARLRSLRPHVGVVAVGSESAASLSALPVLAKWTSFDEVLAAVERACADARSAGREA